MLVYLNVGLGRATLWPPAHLIFPWMTLFFLALGDFGKALLQKFGNSATLAESVTQITTSGATKDELHKLSDYIDAAHEVASCRYELNTHWGNEVRGIHILRSILISP